VLEPAGLDGAVHAALLRRVGLPPPAPRTIVFTIADRAGARVAPDARVALRVERVNGDVELGKVLVDLLGRPVGQRIDLDDAVMIVVELDLGDGRA
jgi:hypothetical protein